MPLTDFLKAQQNLQDLLVPPSVRSLLESQQQVRDLLSPPAVQDLVEIQKKWNTLFKPIPFWDFKPIMDIPENKIFSDAFSALENINKLFAVTESVDFMPTFSYANYDFLNFIDDIPDEETKEIETVIVDQTRGIKKIITDIYQDNSNLLKVEPRQFEEMIAELLFSKGFKVELTKQTRDNGYDIIALAWLGNNFPMKFLVECKRFKKNKVGVEIVRSFKDVIQTEKANKGIIVTTSYFTRDANKKRLETPYLLDYKDKDDVLLWVNEYCNR